MAAEIYIWIIIAAALISWVQPNPYNPIVMLLHRLTQPVYAMIKRFIPTAIGGFDLAPIIVIVAVQFISQILSSLLYNMAISL